MPNRHKNRRRCLMKQRRCQYFCNMTKFSKRKISMSQLSDRTRKIWVALFTASVLIFTVFVLTSCGVQPEKQIQTVVQIVRPPVPAIPQSCYASGYLTFKLITKQSTDKTPTGNLISAAQSNKNRIARNKERAVSCECMIYRLWPTDEDKKRLNGSCDAMSKKEPS